MGYYELASGSTIYISSQGSCTNLCVGLNADSFLDAVTPGNPPTIAALNLPAGYNLNGIAAGNTIIYGSQLQLEGGVGNGIVTANLTSGSVRYTPTDQSIDFGSFATPIVMSSGTVWIGCSGFYSIVPPTDICLAQPVYVNGWSIFPGTNTTLTGGSQLGERFGIDESPTGNSGPFTITDSTPSICTLANQADHNFDLVATGTPGMCTVTVTDAHGVTQTINALSTTVSGTIQTRPRAPLLRRGVLP